MTQAVLVSMCHHCNDCTAEFAQNNTIREATTALRRAVSEMYQ
jgi:hypothetical protein